MKRLIYASLLALILPSCAAYHQGNLIPARGILQEESKIQYLENIEGKANASYFLGLGGLEQSKLIKLAKENMLSKHKLASNEILLDYTLDSKTLWIVPPFYYKKTVFITADVYRIGASSKAGKNVDEQSMKQDQKSEESIKLEAGDVVYFMEDGEYTEAKVLSYKYPFARLEYKKKDEKATIEKIIKELYKKEGDTFKSIIE